MAGFAFFILGFLLAAIPFFMLGLIFASVFDVAAWLDRVLKRRTNGGD